MYSEEQDVEGDKYLRDAFGFIWKHVDAADGEPHWVKTHHTSFEEMVFNGE